MEPLIFNTQSGILKVHSKNNYYYLDFPSRKPHPAKLPIPIQNALNIQPTNVFKARDYVLVYENEQQIKIY